MKKFIKINTTKRSYNQKYNIKVFHINMHKINFYYYQSRLTK